MDIQQQLTTEIENMKSTEVELQLAEQQLMDNPEFKKFLNLQKAVNEKASEVWKHVEQVMLDNDIKTIKGEFGSVTLTERQSWDIDESELPKKFFKRVVDTKRVTDTFRLEGKAPKGCTSKVTKFITKRLK